MFSAILSKPCGVHEETHAKGGDSKKRVRNYWFLIPIYYQEVAK